MKFKTDISRILLCSNIHFLLSKERLFNAYF
uniref:Uncharacterized protein n=1 Tax=Lepeophtheirus salmonis TaxID=72036 RepID=A0A0K2T8Y0_LEPSM